MACRDIISVRRALRRVLRFEEETILVAGFLEEVAFELDLERWVTFVR